MTLGQKLQLIRKENRLTQEAFAERMGVSRQTVSRWESGHTEPELEKVRLMNEQFGLSKEFLLSEAGENGKYLYHHRPRTIFWVATAVIFSGLGIASVGWSISRLSLTILGVIMNIVGCVLFECYLCDLIEKYVRIHLRYQFYLLNIWMLLPAPIFLLISLTICFEQFQPALPYVLGGCMYLVLAVLTSWKIMRKIKAD